LRNPALVKTLPTIIVLVLVLAAGGVSAVGLQPTPIQDAMRAGVESDNWRAALDLYFATDQDFEDDFGQSVSGKKSVFKAVLFSTLVPGGGQYYLGNHRSARYFFAAEALTWMGYAAFRTYGNWKKDDYISYAAVHANAQLEGKSDEYADLVGFYDDLRAYNTVGRVGNPERPYYPDIPKYHWQWQSTQDQRTYRDLKNRSREAYRRADFMILIAVVDRVISVIDAVWGVRRANRRLSSASPKKRPDVQFSINPFSSSRQVSLTIYNDL
jgi:hypothetical protein